ncbi:Peroxin-3 [Ascosphaera apis ARSEF 7405]|uniref:Peroxin-3 n=1 Tax=Ascosphaera apis ARSEF 7405 TaxID=392613 RepID=A0A167UZ48_9EURO|nr:Peroxin-3 [Ascosphaera apis ARSEF 7405]
MIGATRRWLRRKRGPIAIGIGVIGAGYLAGQYVIGKINEARERMASERTARENLRRRFEQNQADCTFTVLGLLYTATDNICQALPVEQLTQELQQKRTRRQSRKSIGEGSADGSSVTGATTPAGENNEEAQTAAAPSTSRRGSQAEGASADTPKQKSRMQLWNELKIISLTRSFTLLYTLSLLTILTRIQLNLLGRRSYLASVVSLATPARQFSGISLEDHDDDHFQSSLYGGDFETDKRYLAFSWWLLHRGWKDIMETVKEAVIEVFGPVSPREEISQEKLSELTREVRKRVEGETNEARQAKRWLPYIMPPRDQEEAVLQEAGVPLDSPDILADGSLLRTLLDETSDLIDSPPFCQIVIALNDEGFSTLIDRNCALEVFSGYRSTAFSSEHIDPQSLESSMSTDISQLSGSKVKFANILATISRQAHVIGNSTEPPNEYLTTMEENVRELEAFAAVVYSNNLGLDEFQRQELVDIPPAAEMSEESGHEELRFRHGGVIEDEYEDEDAKAFDNVWGKASRS